MTQEDDYTNDLWLDLPTTSAWSSEDIFLEKPKSSWLKKKMTNQILMPRDKRNTHDDFHVIPVIEFGAIESYDVLARHKKTGIYEHIAEHIVAPDSPDGVAFNQGYTIEFDTNQQVQCIRLNSHNEAHLLKLAEKNAQNRNEETRSIIALPEDMELAHTLLKHESLVRAEVERGLFPGKNRQHQRLYEALSEDLQKDPKIALAFSNADNFEPHPTLQNDKEFAISVAQHTNRKKIGSEDSALEHFAKLFPELHKDKEVDDALRKQLKYDVHSQRTLDDAYDIFIPSRLRDKYSDFVVNIQYEAHPDGYDTKFQTMGNKDGIYQKIHEGDAPIYCDSSSPLPYETRYQVEQLQKPHITLNTGNREYLMDIAEKNSHNRYNDLDAGNLEPSDPNFKTLMSDKEFVMAWAPGFRDNHSQHLSDELKADKEVAYAIATKAQNASIESFSDEIKSDNELVGHFLNSTASNIEHLPEQFSQDREVVRNLLSKERNGRFIRNTNFNDDKEMALIALEHGASLPGLSKRLRHDSDIQAKAILEHPYNYLDVTDEFKNDPANKEVFQQMVDADPDMYHRLPQQFSEDIDIAKVYLSSDHRHTSHPYYAFRSNYTDDQMDLGEYGSLEDHVDFLPEVFHDNTELARIALANRNVDASQIARNSPSELINDEQFCQRLLARGAQLDTFPEPCRDNENYAVYAVLGNKDNFQYLSDRIRDNENILLVATTGRRKLEHDPRFNNTADAIKLMEEFGRTPNYSDNNEPVAFASERLKQKFSNNNPYEYIKKEEQVQSLASRLEALYGSGDDEEEEPVQKLGRQRDADFSHDSESGKVHSMDEAQARMKASRERSMGMKNKI